MIQPLIVRPLTDGRYEIIAGERRWRAATEAGLETVPVLLRDEDEGERLQTALIENVAREQLNPVDEARACATLVEDLGLTKEELGKRLGRSRASLSNLIRILDLPDEALALLEAGELSEGHGRAILIAKSADERRGAGPRRRPQRLVGARDRAPRERRRLGPAEAEGGARPRPGRGAHQGRGGAGVGARPRRAGARDRQEGRAARRAAFDDLDDLLEFARRARRATGG